MSWQTENLQPASFRGVPFHVSSDDIDVGRNGVTHEFPQRDTPYREDMGRAPREISIKAFVIGDDCHWKRNALMEALEAEGPGTLIHPSLGEMTVSVNGKCKVTESTAGRVIEFDLSFVESGDVVWPTEVLGPEDTIGNAADGLDVAAKSDFESAWDCVTGAGDVLVSGVDSITSSVDATTVIMSQYLSAETAGAVVSALYDLNAAATTLAATPGVLADAWISVFEAVDSLAASNALTAAYQDSAIISAAAAIVAGLTPTQQQIADNRAALDRLLWLLALAQSARLAGAETWTVYDDAQAQAGILSDGLEAASDPATTDTYVALTDLRVGVVSGILDASARLPKLVDYTPVELTSTLEMAQYLYRDADRAGEIATRNGICHPGFVPSVALKVLNA